MGNDTMRVKVGCELRFASTADTLAVIQVQPASSEAQRILHEALTTDPPASPSTYLDGFQNTCRRWAMPAGDVGFQYDAMVEVPAIPDAVDTTAPEVAPVDLPDDCLVFTQPSRYCLSDLLGYWAWELFGAVEPGWGRVQAICDWVHDNVRYEPGSSNSMTTAFEVYQNRVGVCRDFAHLALTFCRGLHIPARYVVGYIPDTSWPIEEPMDFAAWFEAYLGDRWWTFDARNNSPMTGRVVVGRGRDALDIAMVTTYSQVPLTGFRVWAETQPTSL